MIRLLHWLVIGMFVLPLFACGGGGSGGTAAAPGPGDPAAPVYTATLTGTVTDSNLEPVIKEPVNPDDPLLTATVTVTNLVTNKVVTLTTDRNGYYKYVQEQGLPDMAPLTIAFEGPGPEWFATKRPVTLVLDQTTVLDVSLLTTSPTAPLPIDATVDNTDPNDVESVVAIPPALVATPQTASIGIPIDSLLLADGSAYTGMADVYITPVDIGYSETGFGPYHESWASPLSVTPQALGVDETLEVFGAAAFKVLDITTNAPLGLSPSPDDATLVIPIPADPAFLRDNAVELGGDATLYTIDDNGNLIAGGPATLDDLNWTYTGQVDSPGLWFAGVRHPDNVTTTVTSIAGTLAYSDASPAGGVTMYLMGTDHGEGMMTTTGADGSFSALGLTGGFFEATFVVWDNGAQQTHTVAFPDPAITPTGLDETTVDSGLHTLDPVSLPYVNPSLDTIPTATNSITVDSSLALAPSQVGYIFSSGRVTTGGESNPLGNITLLDYSDMVFQAWPVDITSFPGQQLSMESQLGGFALYDGQTPSTDDALYSPSIILVNSDPITFEPVYPAFPLTYVFKKEGQNYYAKITFNSAADIEDLSVGVLDPTTWKVTFDHAFSLSAGGL